MRRRIAKWGGLLLAVCVVATPAAQLPVMDPATDQAIRSYRLDRGNTEVILKTLKEVTAAVLKDPDWMTKLQGRMKLTLEEQCKAMEADAATGPILRANRVPPESTRSACSRCGPPHSQMPAWAWRSWPIPPTSPSSRRIRPSSNG